MQGQGQGQNIFYQLANGEIPSKTVYENESVRAILDTKPAGKGHALLLPKQQVQVTPQFDKKLTQDMADAIQMVSGDALKAFDIDGTSIFVGNGPAAGQKAPHVLLHVIPRKENDGIGLKPQPKHLPDNEYNEVKTKIMNALGVQQQNTQQSKQPSQQPTKQTSQRSPQQPSEEDVDFDTIQDMFT